MSVIFEDPKIWIPKLFIFACLAFILGLALGIKLPADLFIGTFFLFLLALFLLFCLLLEQKKEIIIVVFAISLFFGLWRMSSALRQSQREDLNQYFGREKKFQAVVAKEPEVLTSTRKTEIYIPELDAKALMKMPLYPVFHLGDKILVRAKLEEPLNQKSFDYKESLEKKGIYFLINHPAIEVLSRAQGFSLKRTLVFLKEGMEKRIEQISPFPEAGFFKALLFGSEEDIPFAWKEKLNTTGTRHIVAVSGANITIISSIVLNLLLGLGLWRRQAFYLSSLFIFSYVLMIGAPASAVRAGIMGFFLLLAQQSGRIPDPERLSIIVLAIMLFFAPLLIFDIGFQLSFLSFLGLVYFSPFFSKVFKNFPCFLAIRENLSATFGAQLMALPLLLYDFGRLSLISPLANIFVLPTIPF